MCQLTTLYSVSERRGDALLTHYRFECGRAVFSCRNNKFAHNSAKVVIFLPTMAAEGEKLRLDNSYFYAASLQSLEHMTGYAVVGDDLIHVVDTADAAETTASELR